MIAAVDQRNGIGKNNRLPWHLSDDLKNFRRLTMGHHVLMGSKTYEASQGKMPGRKLIVLSRDPAFQPADAQVARFLDQGVELARAAGEEELFIIGGAQVYALAMPMAQRLVLTRVETDARCDVFFPEYDMRAWKLIDGKRFPAGKKNDWGFEILTLEKVPADQE
ncbi:MAG: dihydrofolate reductase [Anaerolineales bacterium]